MDFERITAASNLVLSYLIHIGSCLPLRRVYNMTDYPVSLNLDGTSHTSVRSPAPARLLGGFDKLIGVIIVGGPETSEACPMI